MSITIYGNLTMAGNSSITNTNSSGGPTPAQLITAVPEGNAYGREPSVDVEDSVVEDPVVEDQAVEQLPMEQLALEAPCRRRGQSVPIAQPPRAPRRANAPPQRRRSSRIALRIERRNTPPPRRALPSVHEDFDYWSKIWTLPPNLLCYLSPGWLPDWTTRDLLRQIIWHFKPNQRIPCGALKANIIELFEHHVAFQYDNIRRFRLAFVLLIGIAFVLFQLNGVVRQGKVRNRQNGTHHENQLRRLRLTRATANLSTPLHAHEGSQARDTSFQRALHNVVRRRSLSTGDLGAVKFQSSSKGRNREPLSCEGAEAAHKRS
ncbi:uncharacterized protein MELLADRAFT_111275 [Melampsora larici-populina 98AG31]|uniref:Uncharacterized protein n=1 Tax=Melampsora larici-populina (strain 98AG31 / pathotype 3-4-7) TaxID=747676 RepID=F4S2K8_MELLP|nr:uncharacterized protein MELLADRAFT_111275 [Melampsora larici-populina 98AG31]EGG01020.1 hypothetical protein MELLADRAFT_111275 [Melampsora larici-populina 98AG31]